MPGWSSLNNCYFEPELLAFALLKIPSLKDRARHIFLCQTLQVSLGLSPRRAHLLRKQEGWVQGCLSPFCASQLSPRNCIPATVSPCQARGVPGKRAGNTLRPVELQPGWVLAERSLPASHCTARHKAGTGHGNRYTHFLKIKR